MRVSKWGNSLAVRLPASVVAALKLKEGEEIEIHATGAHSLEIARLHKFRAQVPRQAACGFQV